MKVSKAEVVQVFQALGFATADGWPDKRLLDKIKGLPELIDEDTGLDDDDLNNVLDELIACVNEGEEIELVAADKPKQTKATKKQPVEAAEADDEDLEEDEDDLEEDDFVEDDEDEDLADEEEAVEEVKPKPKKKPAKKVTTATEKPAKKKSAKAAKEKPTKPTKKKSTKVAKEKPTKPKQEIKRAGVIQALRQMLTSSSEKKPLTKDQMLEQLASQFPDRDPEGMRKTIHCQVPSRLRKEGMNIQEAEKGCYYVA